MKKVKTESKKGDVILPKEFDKMTKSKKEELLKILRQTVKCLETLLGCKARANVLLNKVSNEELVGLLEIGEFKELNEKISILDREIYQPEKIKKVEPQMKKVK